MLTAADSRLSIWTSLEKVQTYHENYVRELEARAHAEELAKCTLASVLEGDIKGSGNCRSPSVASLVSGGSSFTTEEASGDSSTPLDLGHTCDTASGPRSPGSQSFGVAHDDKAAWPISFYYTPKSYPALQLPKASPDLHFWDSHSPDPNMGIYHPGQASMALNGDYHVPGEVPQLSPIERPQRPSPELSTTRGSASRSLRAPITTIEVARPEDWDIMESTEEEIFNSFFEEMCRPMPAYHFVAP